MAEKIIISADSTCDLGRELKEQYHVEYYPLHIILEEKDYLDNVTIQPEELYRAYEQRKVLPKTAAVNAAEYIQYFEPWVKQGYDVVHVNLGGALSSSYQNCCLAAEELGHVYPVDSCNLSTGTGHLVLDGVKMAAAGLGAGEIQRRLNERRGRVHSSFILDTLKFMAAGGRCSAVTAFGANLLNLKLCIEVDNRSGAMGVGKKYRGNLDKVLVRYTKDQLAGYEKINTDKIFITHSGIDEAYIELVKKTIQETMHFEHIYVTRASCTISSHCGPNTLGILFETEA